MLPFLGVASEIKGNLITFLIAREVGSFFDGGSEAIRDVMPDCFSKSMSQKTIEKMLRVASLMACVTGGLRGEPQSCLWMSDADEALETFERREQLARLCSYITYGLTNWKQPAEIRFGTNRDAGIPTWCRDAAAIPDLVAGAYCKLADILPTFRGVRHGIRIVPKDTLRDERARIIGDWLFTANGPLRHILARLERDELGEIRASAQCFVRDYR
ncbi:MAG: hypothetical protein EON56_04935 [Alphaproteobacteria bacterium]|nr:MAG: hypothetical protein EON56_04935 [Alphaproteobacteria bacterium]